MTIQIGSRVNRTENREVTGATVLEIEPSNDPFFGRLVKIAYDEGGEGWWPESSLSLIQYNPT